MKRVAFSIAALLLLALIRPDLGLISSAEALPFQLEFPLRADDLKPFHYARISQDEPIWDDIKIVRIDRQTGRVEVQLPGGSGEEEETSWNIPVYAGIDGEVISCWRNYPYNPVYDRSQHPAGGNYLLIHTTRRLIGSLKHYYVYYAHLQTNSIPKSLCPNESATGWMKNRTKMQQYNATESTGIQEEAYVRHDLRAKVKKGQFIGRIGAHGNSAGAHLHMHVAMLNENALGLVQKIPDSFQQMAFSDVWYQTQNAFSPDKWQLASGADIPELAKTDFVMIWPSIKHEATFTAPSRLTRFNGDNRVDLLCHNTANGKLYLDYSANGQYTGTDWTGAGSWCNKAAQRLHKGDFNGDGLTDLLCHDIDQGKLWLDHADSSGRFEGTDATGFLDPEGDKKEPWCNKKAQQLRIGDFNGDGHDDLLCHDVESGKKWVDLAVAGGPWGPTAKFEGADWKTGSAWCKGYFHRLHIGNFDGKIGDDLLCHDTLKGNLYLDYSSYQLPLALKGTDWAGSTWCYGQGQRLFIGDFDANGRDDLLCHDSDNGRMYIDYADVKGRFAGTDRTIEPTGENGWCTAFSHRLYVGDMNGDGRDDLLCHDQESGRRWVDLAEKNAVFEGTDWVTQSDWCSSPTQGLH